MSVLIKGMEMPKSSRVCPFAVMAGDWEKECIVGGRYEWNPGRVCKDCPLVEVPTPHGRLIDANQLLEAMYHRAFEEDGDTMWKSGCWVRYRAIEKVQDAMPTIIEAEAEDEHERFE